MGITRIGLVVNQDLHYYRDNLRGIKDYAVQPTEWVVVTIAPRQEAMGSRTDRRPVQLTTHRCLYLNPQRIPK
jgi:hypothetical protein